MRRILTPPRYERRLHNDNPAGPTMIAHRAYTHLTMPVADNSPEADPITVSGRVVRGDNQGRLLLDPFGEPYTESLIYPEPAKCNIGLQVHTMPHTYKRVFIYRPWDFFVSHIWYCLADGTHAHRFYMEPPHEIKESPTWYFTESEGMPGYTFTFKVICLR